MASPLRYDTGNFLRRRALAERYAYLLAAFPDPGTEPVDLPPPPAPEPEMDLEPSGAGVQAGVVVAQAYVGEAILDPIHQLPHAESLPARGTLLPANTIRGRCSDFASG